MLWLNDSSVFVYGYSTLYVPREGRGRYIKNILGKGHVELHTHTHTKPLPGPLFKGVDKILAPKCFSLVFKMPYQRCYLSG